MPGLGPSLYCAAIWRILRAVHSLQNNAGERFMRRFASAMRREAAPTPGLARRALSSTPAARLWAASPVTAPVCATVAARPWIVRVSALTALTAWLVLTAATAAAGSIDSLSSKDAAGGMKAAISQGID